MGEPIDAILIGFHETAMPPVMGRLPSDDPLGYYYRSAFLRIDGRDVEPMTALSRMNNEATGRDGFHHWPEAAPLGLHFLTGYLRRRSFRVEMIRFLGGEYERLAHMLENDAPRSVCILTTFLVDPLPILDAVSFIRRHNDKVKIILGGPFIQDVLRERAGSALHKALETLGADIVVRSSTGEKTLARVLSRLESGGSLENVPNLVVLEHGKVVAVTADEPEESDIDEPVDWDALSEDELGSAVNFRTSVSCPFACEFCEFPVRAGSHRLASLETVEHQLRVLSRRGVRHVCFVDDTFNVPLPRFREICRLLAKRFSFRWSSFFRASSGYGGELYDLMRDSGCTALHLGIESGDERMLASMGKAAKVAQYERAIEHLNERQILSYAALIVGFPGETEESLKNTVDFINRAQPTTYRAQPFFYHHHAPVHRRAAEHGLVGKGWNWRHATMNSGQAVLAAQSLRAAVRGPRFTGDRQLHIFMLGPLLCKGMHRQDLIEALSSMDDVQRTSFDTRVGQGRGTEHAAHIERLRTLCRRIRLEPARYSMAVVDRYPYDFDQVAARRRDYMAIELRQGLWPRRGPERPRRLHGS